MPNRKKKFIRIISIGLITALFAGVALSSQTKVVQAKDVFLGVQTIRNNNLDTSSETFTILEIVDKVGSYKIDDGNGNFLIDAHGVFTEDVGIDLGEEEIGYLVGGEEPFQDIYKELIYYSSGYSNINANQPLQQEQKEQMVAIETIYNALIEAIKTEDPNMFTTGGPFTLVEEVSYSPNPLEYEDCLRFVNNEKTSGYMVLDDTGAYVGEPNPNNPGGPPVRFFYVGDASTPSLLFDWNLEEKSDEKEDVSGNSTTKEETVENVSDNSVSKEETTEEGTDEESNVDDKTETESGDKTETDEGTDSNENPTDPSVTPSNPDETPTNPTDPSVTPTNPDETSSNTTETTTDSSTTSAETSTTTETNQTTGEETDITPQNLDDENVDDQVALSYRKEVVYGKQNVMMATIDVPQRYRFEPSEPSEPYYKVATKVNQNSGTDEILIDAIYEFRFVGIKNNEWFKNHVFGLEVEAKNDVISTDKMNVDVVTTTPDDQELAAKIEQADLVYWNADFSENKDITTANARKLLGRITGQDTLPIIVNDNVYTTLNPNTGAVNNNNNINKLIHILYQEDVRETFENSTYKFEESATWEIAINSNNSPWTTIGALIQNATKPEDSTYLNNGHFVRDNVYVINHGIHSTEKGLNVKVSNSDDEITKGFSEVLYRIEQEVYERQQKGVMTWDDKSSPITPALAIQTILTYSAVPPVIEKSHIKVLELQPCYSFDYFGKTDKMDEFKNLFLAGNSQVEVEIIGMTTSEFCGKLEDINVEYDMIYIGSNTDLMNRINVATDGSPIDYCTVYNDFNMYGIVYSHIGDLCHINNAHAGLINKQEKEMNTYRYSGNDILREQEEDFIDFLKSGAPIVVEDDFFFRDASTDKNVVAISSGPVKNASNQLVTITDTVKNVGGITRNGILDSSTYLYQFMKQACANDGIAYGENGWSWENRKYQNFLSVSDLAESDAKAKFVRWINQPKMSIHMMSQPTEYNYTTKQIGGVDVIADSSYLEKSSDGNYYLTYEFYISNIATTDVQNTSYTVSLFVDANMDGKFSSTLEDLSGGYMKVVNMETNGEVDRTGLKTGVHYRVSRVLPYDAVGAIPWKLVVQHSGDDKEEIRTAVTGITAVKMPEKQNVKVLQLYDGDSNIEEKMKNASNYWHILLENVPDFKVEITSVHATNYFTGAETIDINDYDMLILGFKDVYQSGTNFKKETLDAIIEYAESGKCILFSHDNTNWLNGSGQNGTLNMYIRDLTGLDRYGVTVYRTTDANAYTNNRVKNGDSIIPSNGQTLREVIIDSIGSSGQTRDIAFAINTDQKVMDSRTQGLTYSGNEHDRIRDTSSKSDYITFGANKYGDYYRYLNFYEALGANEAIGKSWIDRNNHQVEKVNQGAITEYPYRLAKTINVKQTHAQYYQLDLESDKDGDGEGDIVVWYTMNNSISGDKNDVYDHSPNDVRNNYYIYNRGNITYTGMGHRTIDNNAEEIKLFINTMIAAYRVSIQSPKLTIVEENDYSTEKRFDAIPAEEMLINNENHYSLYFKVEDMNLVSEAAKDIRIKIYLEGGADSITIDSNVISVTDKTMDTEWQVFDPSTGSALTADPSGYYKLTEGKVYYVRIPLREEGGTVENLSELKSLDLYMEAQTVIYKKGKVIESAFVYDNFKLTQINLFDLD